ncbi:ABC transporter permease subunit [Leifsonia poae]|uniref:Maltose/maltodextrin transport system permease protein n=1 Tax=Leifsonia poae TaxID=110933 RepID=A0A9W6HAK1_9MICO|nr:ABC transporter permease subunit [Leifsonia poae]GLJ76377.1 sugar ABC transporter permease [Leifsonia poae]
MTIQHERATTLDVPPPSTDAPLPPPRERRSGGILGLVVKIVLLGLLDAFAVWAILIMAGLQMWVPIAITVVITGIINWIYIGAGKRLPAKYLTPGVFFLLVFQVFVIGFSGYVAFTNYSDGHNSTKSDAISAIESTGAKRVPDSPVYQVNVLKKDGTLYLLATDEKGVSSIGTTDQPLSPVDDPTNVPGYTTLQLSEVLDNQSAIADLRVPVSDDPQDGFLRTDDATTAYVFRSDVVYDAKTDTFVDGNGVVYSDNGKGAFASESGKALSPGWKVDVGFANFVKAFTNPQLSGPLLRVILWTFAFAILSVLLSFALGLFLATVLNHPSLRGKKFYRVLVILPYAFPPFLSGLVWAGLLNPQFGFINQVLFGGAEIPWLTDPWLARLSVVLVNVWLGYPYMFLVCLGALQSLPQEVDEAAKVDGARAWRIFRSIKLPLLLVSLAPLLIASFAFNFNNFNAIYMLTKGWPRFTDTTFDIGSTDLLITMVYKVAFGSGGARDYGLASALSILIFILVGVISVIAFRRTKSLEEIN